MNNLHRHLAPISDAAWAEIDDEARQTFTTTIAARRVVDVPEAEGVAFSAVSRGRVRSVDAGYDGVEAQRREVVPVAEFRVPFTVSRTEVDNVLRGALDADWDAVKAAAVKIAHAEDRTIVHGSDALGISGIAPESTNATVPLPSDILEFPAAVAKAVSALRLVGVSGPYRLLLSAELYTLVAETTDHGYPIRDHVERVLRDGEVIWAPAIDGAVLVSARGGDFELNLGQDLSIGYLSHDADSVELYLQESFTFRVATAEASVVIA